jgi:head-tail adaptor
MRLGKMDRRVTVRRATTPARNALNEPIEVWTDLGTFWAEQLSQAPRESWKAAQTAAQVERVWRLGWNQRTASISPSDRLVCDGREYQIIGVTEVGRRKGVEIVAIGSEEEGLSP